MKTFKMVDKDVMAQGHSLAREIQALTEEWYMGTNTVLIGPGTQVRTGVATKINPCQEHPRGDS